MKWGSATHLAMMRSVWLASMIPASSCRACWTTFRMCTPKVDNAPESTSSAFSAPCTLNTPSSCSWKASKFGSLVNRRSRSRRPSRSPTSGLSSSRPFHSLQVSIGLNSRSCPKIYFVDRRHSFVNLAALVDQYLTFPKATLESPISLLFQLFGLSIQTV